MDKTTHKLSVDRKIVTSKRRPYFTVLYFFLPKKVIVHIMWWKYRGVSYNGALASKYTRLRRQHYIILNRMNSTDVKQVFGDLTVI